MRFIRFASMGILALVWLGATSGEAWAAGSNPAAPAPAALTPSPTTTETPQSQVSYIEPYWYYHNFWSSFYAGEEYNKVANAFSTGDARMGLNVALISDGMNWYNLKKEAIIRDHATPASDSGADLISIDSKGNTTVRRQRLDILNKEWWSNPPVQLSANGQFLGASAAPTTSTGSTSNNGSGRIFDTSTDLFVSFYGQTMHSMLDTTGTSGTGATESELNVLNIGPIASWGYTIDDSQSNASQKTYGGIRAALNPEVYLDYMIGSTVGVDGLRFDIRTQFPVIQIGKVKAFVGGEANLAARTGQAPDSVKFFAVAQTNMSTLTSLVTGLQK
jgi:hypothetical protein